MIAGEYNEFSRPLTNFSLEGILQSKQHESLREYELCDEIKQRIGSGKGTSKCRRNLCLTSDSSIVIDKVNHDL